MAEKPAAKSPGQPTKYKPEYCEMLIAHMKSGRAFQTFGSVVNVSKKTLQNWLKVHKKFEEAKGIGESHSYYWWESQIMDSIEDGVRMNAAPLIFAMKNRFGWRDKPAEEADPDDEDKKSGAEDKKLTKDELVDMVNQARGIKT